MFFIFFLPSSDERNNGANLVIRQSSSNRRAGAKAGHRGSAATVLNGFEKVSVGGEFEKNPIIEGGSFLAFAAIAVTGGAGRAVQAFTRCRIPLDPAAA
jgi:hypothetical protein